MSDIQLIRLDHYEGWLRSEGIPIKRGLFVEDVNSIDLAKWPRMGGQGAFINFDACSGIVNSYLCAIPPGSKLIKQKHLFDELVYILDGQGYTTLWDGGGSGQTVEWGRGSLFALPMNAAYQHFNESNSKEARYIAVTTAPLMINLFRNLEFIFDNSFDFKDRYLGQSEYWSEQGKVLGFVGDQPLLQVNFVRDVLASATSEESGQSQMRYADYTMAGGTLSPYLAELPVGSYHRAHRHGPSAHILFLTGKGYTLFWKEGEEKTRVDWKPGSMVVPPDKIMHQHFNTSNVPGRSLRFTIAPRASALRTIGDLMWPTTEADQIEFEDEDPEIRSMFEAELAKAGDKSTMSS